MSLHQLQNHQALTITGAPTRNRSQQVVSLAQQSQVTRLPGATHSAAGGQKVDDVVVELGHVVAHIHLGVSVSGPRVVLSHVHPQDRAHNPDDESGKAKGNNARKEFVSCEAVPTLEDAEREVSVVMLLRRKCGTPLPSSHSFTVSALNIIGFSEFLNYVLLFDGKTVKAAQRL